MNTEYPIGAHVLIYRNNNAWSVISCFPAGYNIPLTAMNFDIRTKSTLHEVYSLITKHHADPQLSGGHEPAKDETSEPTAVPNGAIIDIERDKNSWKAILRYPDKGMRFRSAPFKSIKDVFENITLNNLV